MAPEKRKGKSSERPDWKLATGLVAVAAILIASVGVVIYLARPIPSMPPPVYEEVPSTPAGLNAEIAKIDEAIYASLYQEGVAPGNVLFLAVEMRQEMGLEWEFTEMLIKVPEKGVVDRLEAVLNGAVSALGLHVSQQREQYSSGDGVWSLFAQGHCTHRIRLMVDDETRKLQESPMRRPRIAIVIDDLGYDMEMARAFIHFDAPMTLSVLPKSPHGSVIAGEAREKGHDVLLHLPMEPRGYPRLSPGPGALLMRMKGEAIGGILRDHLARIPGVQGVNNHMGSRFSESEEGMWAVFHELKQRGLFYLDSRTTHRSVAARLGRKMGIPVVTRSVFLDNHLSRSAMRIQTDRLVALARNQRYAIGIGHPHRETLRFLRDSLSDLKRNAEIVPVSELLVEAGGRSLEEDAGSVRPARRGQPG